MTCVVICIVSTKIFLYLFLFQKWYPVPGGGATPAARWPAPCPVDRDARAQPMQPLSPVAGGVMRSSSLTACSGSKKRSGVAVSVYLNVIYR